MWPSTCMQQMCKKIMSMALDHKMKGVFPCLKWTKITWERGMHLQQPIARQWLNCRLGQRQPKSCDPTMLLALRLSEQSPGRCGHKCKCCFFTSTTPRTIVRFQHSGDWHITFVNCHCPPQPWPRSDKPSDSVSLVDLQYGDVDGLTK